MNGHLRKTHPNQNEFFSERLGSKRSRTVHIITSWRYRNAESCAVFFDRLLLLASPPKARLLLLAIVAVQKAENEPLKIFMWLSLFQSYPHQAHPCPQKCIARPAERDQSGPRPERYRSWTRPERYRSDCLHWDGGCERIARPPPGPARRHGGTSWRTSPVRRVRRNSTMARTSNSSSKNMNGHVWWISRRFNS